MMSRIISRLTITLLGTAALLPLAGCRTTEANYRAAYEVAKASRQADADLDDGLDADTRRRLSESAMRSVPVIYFTVADGNVAADSIPHYCVAVNCFRQLFNAKELRARIERAGYSGAFVAKTASADYYVMAGGADEMPTADALLAGVKADGSLPKASSAEYPKIITYAGFRLN